MLATDVCDHEYKFPVNAEQRPGLNHIAVYVMDLKISTAFYKDIIGLDTIPEPFHDGRHTWFASELKVIYILYPEPKQKQNTIRIHTCAFQYHQ